MELEILKEMSDSRVGTGKTNKQKKKMRLSTKIAETEI